MNGYLKILCAILIILILSASTVYAVNIDAVSQREAAFPVRYLCESIGGTVTWDSAKKTAKVQYKDKYIELKIGSGQINSNGVVKSLDNRVSAWGGRILLPLSVLNRELGTEFAEDNCLYIIGERFIGLLKDRKISEAEALLSQAFSQYFTADNLEMLADVIANPDFDFNKAILTKNPIHQNLNIPFIIQQKNNNFIIRFDYSGKIDEFAIANREPALEYSLPQYAGSSNYSEVEVGFGNDIWKLPGTLTLPEGDGPFPVVVLVHDNGVYDRDESTGALKPFRDLAAGLASQNIAVFRYEKRTLEHSTKIGLIANFTMNEETEQDAFAAAEYLRTNSKVDSSRIILLGHGQGGYALPQIMSAGESVFDAGIILGGNIRPQYEIQVEQLEYLVSKGLADKSKLDYMRNQAAIISDAAFKPNNLPEGYTLGHELYYDYMKNYDIFKVAGSIEKPMLILQGGRDYQVNPDIDFKGWEKALENTNASFKLYPELNHMFTAGKGDSIPDEYNISSNIPQYVIDDIAKFIRNME